METINSLLFNVGAEGNYLRIECAPVQSASDQPTAKTGARLPMCGSDYHKSDKQKIAEAFHATMVDDFPLPPWDYNVPLDFSQFGINVAI